MLRRNFCFGLPGRAAGARVAPDDPLVAWLHAPTPFSPPKPTRPLRGLAISRFDGALSIVVHAPQTAASAAGIYPLGWRSRVAFVLHDARVSDRRERGRYLPLRSAMRGCVRSARRKCFRPSRARLVSTPYVGGVGSRSFGTRHVFQTAASAAGVYPLGRRCRVAFFRHEARVSDRRECGWCLLHRLAVRGRVCSARRREHVCSDDFGVAACLVATHARIGDYTHHPARKGGAIFLRGNSPGRKEYLRSRGLIRSDHES
jgi:hypothetical protein